MMNYQIMVIAQGCYMQFEEILEVTPLKTEAVWWFTSHHTIQSKINKFYRKLLEK